MSWFDNTSVDLNSLVFRQFLRNRSSFQNARYFQKFINSHPSELPPFLFQYTSGQSSYHFSLLE